MVAEPQYGLAHHRQSNYPLTHAQFIAVIKQIRNLAKLAWACAKDANLSRNLQNQATTIRLQAERTGGHYLTALRLKGGDKRSPSRDSLLTLADIGLDRDTSKRWQLVARVPEVEFNRYLENMRSQQLAIASSVMYRRAATYRVDGLSQVAERDRRRISTGDLLKLVERLDDCLTQIHKILLDRVRRFPDRVGNKRNGVSRVSERDLRAAREATSELQRQLKRLETARGQSRNEPDFSEMFATAFGGTN